LEIKSIKAHGRVVDMTDSQARSLAAAIIRQAVDDLKAAPNEISRYTETIKRLEQQLSSETNANTLKKLSVQINDWKSMRNQAVYRKNEVLAFFRGQWFEALAEMINLDPDMIRDELKIARREVA